MSKYFYPNLIFVSTQLGGALKLIGVITKSKQSIIGNAVRKFGVKTKNLAMVLNVPNILTLAWHSLWLSGQVGSMFLIIAIFMNHVI